MATSVPEPVSEPASVTVRTVTASVPVPVSASLLARFTVSRTSRNTDCPSESLLPVVAVTVGAPDAVPEVISAVTTYMRPSEPVPVVNVPVSRWVTVPTVQPGTEMANAESLDESSLWTSETTIQSPVVKPSVASPVAEYVVLELSASEPLQESIVQLPSAPSLEYSASIARMPGSYEALNVDAGFDSLAPRILVKATAYIDPEPMPLAVVPLAPPDRAV